MRDVDTLLGFEDIVILWQYLYMNEAHFITVDMELLTLTPADVTKVLYGKWLNTGSYDAHYQLIYICSVCGKEVADTYIKYHKYCLNCGTKMTEERI